MVYCHINDFEYGHSLTQHLVFVAIGVTGKKPYSITSKLLERNLTQDFVLVLLHLREFLACGWLFYLYELAMSLFISEQKVIVVKLSTD